MWMCLQLRAECRKVLLSIALCLLWHQSASDNGQDTCKNGQQAHVRPLSSTRMGRRPCSSASMSLGLQEWKAPLQMNRMWSVFTLPCLVETTLPSMMGSRSRCTPSLLASAPAQAVQSSECLDVCLLHGSRRKAAHCRAQAASIPGVLMPAHAGA